MIDRWPSRKEERREGREGGRKEGRKGGREGRREWRKKPRSFWPLWSLVHYINPLLSILFGFDFWFLFLWFHTPGPCFPIHFRLIHMSLDDVSEYLEELLPKILPLRNAIPVLTQSNISWEFVGSSLIF